MKKFNVPISLLLSTALLFQNLFPSYLFASTGGPNSPEFAGFEPVGTQNMVNTFTGAFAYNMPVIEIPGPDGGSYALSLSYHSGNSPDQEASWVGYGWNLSPGSISRSIRGFADDANGAEVTHYNQVPFNWTAGIGASYGLNDLEVFGVDIPINLSITTQMQFNNYRGFSLVTTPYVGFTLGMYSLGYTFEEGNKGSLGFSVNPGAILSQALQNSSKTENETKNQSQKVHLSKNLQENYKYRFNKVLNSSQFLSTNYNTYTRPTATTSYTGVSARFTLSGQPDVSFLPVGSSVASVFGTVSMQFPVTEESLKHYGYLYSANAGENDMMDYADEMDMPYKKRDYFLAIPYSLPDIYNVSGEGIGGSFRFYSRYAGHFHTNHKKSETFSGQLGLELQAGLDIGPGGDIGGSYNSLEVAGYGDDDYAFQNEGDEAFYAAYSGDPAKHVDFGSESAVQASANETNAIPGLKEYEFKVSAEIEKTGNGDDRVSRSSFIVQHTNYQMKQTDVGGKYYNNYTRDDSTAQWIDRSDAYIGDGIGEFATYNNDGLRYTYGLPVYSRNEMSLQFGVKSNDANVNLENNYIAYKSDIDTDGSLVKVGTEDNNIYASDYLLTEIATPDYIDRSFDGPSNDDFGGYVKFNYNQHLGNGSGSKSGGNWYQWRVPYSGLIYNKGQLSDLNDDMGNVSMGQREVYYISTVETKTHLAAFYTSDRNDGIEAKQASSSTESGFYDAIKSDYFSSYSSSADRLQKLDSIVLYARNNDGSRGEIIKRVYFEYDYSVWPNQPNTISSTDGTGKLTLKRWWTEYGEVRNARISPFECVYTYPSGKYPSKYSSIDNYGSGKNESPSYTNFLSDRWGYYQESGEDRYENMLQWNDQETNSSFDPAAWQLKQIILPSGGEIHIQYEESDYRYVQDRPALVMTPLLSGNEVTGSAGDIYYLNLDSLGITSDQYDEVIDLIQQEYIDKEEKIYFKFLYTLQGSDVPAINSCNSEYISGYVNVQEVGENGGKVYVKLGTADDDQYTNPREVCLNYYYANHNGFEVDACSMKEFDISEAESLLYEMLEEMSDPFELEGDNECLSVNETYSYLRIPIVNNKLGGGIRVKRLLSYDKGIEGDAILLGKEYVYQNEDGLSSGVATNEPETGGEESALKTFLKVAADQDWVERAISGEDKEQSEGPLGKNILPGASVGYSRVVTKNIFDGINNGGFSIDQFYTAKDYPFNGTWSYEDENDTIQYIKGVDYTTISQQQDWLPIYAVLINTFISNLWLTQGYAFTQNNMHGQPKCSATYLGDNDDINSPENAQLMAMKETGYYQPGEPVKVMDAWNNIEKRQLGKEMEVVFESRSIKDQTTDASAEFDVTIGILVVPPFTIPYITVIPSLSYIEQELYTHVTTTINSYSALPMYTKTYHDGVYTISTNEIFDGTTGNPLITKTTDEFDGLALEGSASEHQGYYYNYSFPAAQQYDEMSRKSIGDGFVVNTADYDDLEIYYQYSTENELLFQGDICSFADKFAPGDLLSIDFASAGVYFYQSAGLNGTTMTIYPIEGFTTIPSSYSGEGITTLTIVRSGRTNQLSQSVGSITTYGNEKTDTSDFSDFKSVRSVDANYITEWNKRQIFASSLTSQLNSGSSTTKIYNDPNIDITNVSTGSCDPMIIQVQYIHQGDTLVQMRVNDNCIEYIVPGGYFSMDSACGKLIYYSPGAECSPTTIECIVFCPGIYPNERIPDVVIASAANLSDEWELDDEIAFYFDVDASAVDNPYSVGNKGKWREQISNVYRENISAITDAGGKVYNSGIFKDSLTLYNWLYNEANNDTFWMPMNNLTKYSPYGSALEQENIIGIKSVTKKGYGFTVPYLTASNASYQSLLFESFENINDDGSYINCEDGFKISEDAADYTAGDFGAIVDSIAHAGSYSYLLGMESVTTTVAIPIGFGSYYYLTLFSHDTTELSLRSVSLDDQIKENGLSIKVWLSVGNSDSDPSGFQLYVENTTAPARSKNVDFEKVARVGEWTLYQANIPKFMGSWPESIVPVLRLKHETQNVEIYLDDIRVQPPNTQMTAYVYDPSNLRIVSMFDDQHFGIYFQYNSEGKLVRKMRETERGLKTVQETQYNVVKQDRQ